ncbi:MAG: M50 family metallopeptidase [Bdellovibrionota bacterium]
MFFKKKEKRHEGKVGGLAFFCSLVFLSLLAPINLLLNLTILNKDSIFAWISFAPCFVLGTLVAHFCIKDHWSVFFHEFKHSFISNLAGNKAKDWDIKKQSGHFEYSYTKSTAAYNAFISLAPYMVPLFSFPVLLISLLLIFDHQIVIVCILGVVYGMDCLMNFRDISPIQTDFTEVRGGFYLGLAYVIAMNLTIFSYYASFISNGIQGPKLLTLKLIEIAYSLVVSYKGIPLDQTPLL